MPSVVSLTPQSGDAVFIINGQSEGGFYGDTANTGAASGSYFFNMLDGGFYTCCDPLPGWAIPPGTGTGGSIWSWLGDLYAASTYKPWNRLIFVPAVVYGSASAAWVPGQANFTNMAIGAYSAMTGRGWTPTAFLWQNGASDNVGIVAGTVAAGDHLAHVTSYVNGLRSAGIGTPVIMARCCLCRLRTNVSPMVPLATDFDAAGQAEKLTRFEAEFQIQKEQAWLAANAPTNAFDGPNLDAISAAHRFDGCHMTNHAQYLAAMLWMNKLLQLKGAGYI